MDSMRGFIGFILVVIASAIAYMFGCHKFLKWWDRRDKRKNKDII